VEGGGIAADDETGTLEEGAKLREGEEAGEEEDASGESGREREGEGAIAYDGDAHGGRGLGEENASELFPVGLGPFFHANTGLGTEGDDGDSGEEAGGVEFVGEGGVGGLADGEEEGGGGYADAEGLEEADGFDDFVLAVMVGDGGGEGGASAGAVIGDDVAGTAHEGNEDVAQVGTDIEEEVEGMPAKAEDEGEGTEGGGTAGGAFADFAPPGEIGDDQLIDGGVILEEIAGPWADAEGDVGVRIFFPQGTEEGGGHDGVADVIWTEDEDAAEGGGGIDGTGAMEEAEEEIERRQDEGEGEALAGGVDAHGEKFEIRNQKFEVSGAQSARFFRFACLRVGPLMVFF
jgi:hypothetical protein